MKTKDIQCKAGVWYKLNRYHTFVCCDCDLVHIYNFRTVKGKLQFRAWRNERSTGQRRRWRKTR